MQTVQSLWYGKILDCFKRAKKKHASAWKIDVNILSKPIIIHSLLSFILLWICISEFLCGFIDFVRHNGIRLERVFGWKKKKMYFKHSCKISDFEMSWMKKSLDELTKMNKNWLTLADQLENGWFKNTHFFIWKPISDKKKLFLIKKKLMFDIKTFWNMNRLIFRDYLHSIYWLPSSSA